jgi:restriction endonuclease Mrr
VTLEPVGGAPLAELMIDRGVAVTRVKAFEIRRVDSDDFAAE